MCLLAAAIWPLASLLTLFITHPSRTATALTYSQIRSSSAHSSHCKNIANDLYSEANAQLEDARVTLSTTADSQLKGFIDHGAAKLGNASDEECAEAKEQLAKFVNALIQGAEEKESPNNAQIGSSPRIVTNAIFRRVRSSVCPLYPFC